VNLGGYADRIARVDLTAGKIAYEGINEEDARKYIGGRGLGLKYLFDHGPLVEPLGPDNMLGFFGGPLTGSLAKQSGRSCLTTKSPLTGTCLDCHIGGKSGAKIRWAGFDGVIFDGAASAPVYAVLQNGEVAIADAADLWGKGIHETVQVLQERHGKDAAVLAIGPAGERQVLFACVINDEDRAFGRGGGGAVMGSKRLKAVVVLGDKKNMPKPRDEAAFRKADQDALEWLRKTPTTEPKSGGLHQFGTNVLMNLMSQLGGLPTKNAQMTSFEGADDISGERVVDTMLAERPTCHACPVACKKLVDVPGGKYKVRMESTEYESVWALGAQCLNNNLESIAFMIDRCNDYGMDTIEMGNALAATMEATEKGLVKEGIGWGDADRMIELIEQMVSRQGLGDVLALGTARAAESFGAPDMAMTVKGMSIAAYDPRLMKGMGLAYATSNRGACHLRAQMVAPEIVGLVCGAERKVDPLEWRGKAELVVEIQNVFSFIDSAELCKFSSFAMPLDVLAALYSSMTGAPMDANTIMRVGERIYNLERHYNNLNGFSGKDDTLPRRFLEEPGQGPIAGQVCELAPMLAEYYEKRGWDDGVVPEAKLRELEIP
jgi:aldehyde:ferredoxin oxidoreductase